MTVVSDLGPEIDALADRMFAAVAAGDTDEILKTHVADCVIWHSFDDREVGLDVVFQILGALVANVKNVRFEEVRRRAFTDGTKGFIQTHVITGILANGDALRVPSCMFIYVKDGWITRVEEYIDSDVVRMLTPQDHTADEASAHLAHS